MINLDTAAGVIQVLLMAILVWGPGIILGIIFLYRFIRDLLRKRISLPTPNIRFWAWAIAIFLTSAIGSIVAGWLSYFQFFPIMQIIFPVFLLLMIATIWYIWKPFPKQEWALVFFLLSPGIAFEVVRRELQAKDSSERPHGSRA
jgi:hypothetical protein